MATTKSALSRKLKREREREDNCILIDKVPRIFVALQGKYQVKTRLGAPHSRDKNDKGHFEIVAGCRRVLLNAAHACR